MSIKISCVCYTHGRAHIIGEANNNAETRMQRFRARTLSHPQFRQGLQVIEPNRKHN
jgi:hypothetical protein